MGFYVVLWGLWRIMGSYGELWGVFRGTMGFCGVVWGIMGFFLGLYGELWGFMGNGQVVPVVVQLCKTRILHHDGPQH